MPQNFCLPRRILINLCYVGKAFNFRKKVCLFILFSFFSFFRFFFHQITCEIEQRQQWRRWSTTTTQHHQQQDLHYHYHYHFDLSNKTCFKHFTDDKSLIRRLARFENDIDRRRRVWNYQIWVRYWEEEKNKHTKINK